MKSKILVIGDLIIDYYLDGKYTKFSPEAPAPVVEYNKIECMLGGAANVASNIHALEGDYEAVFILPSFVPKKEMQLLKHLHTTFITSENHDLTRKTRVLADGQQVMRLDNDNKKRLSEEDERTYLELIEGKLYSRKFEYLVIADYNKNLLSTDMIVKIMAWANEVDVKVLVDTKKQSIACYMGAYVITPNSLEKDRLIDSRPLEFIRYCLTTKGKDGLELSRSRSIEYSCPAIPVENADVNGAGDVVLATVAISLASGNSIVASVKRAQLAAYLGVKKKRTSVVTLEELNSALEKGLHKIVNIEELNHLMRKVHKFNLFKVAFTNGCFDVIHEGHLDLLEQTKDYSYLTVIAVDSNARVAKLKGTNRPINENRLQTLAAIPEADIIIEFDTEEELLEIIKIVKPSVFTKGSDYRGKEIIGKELVESMGGEFKFIERDKPISTTGIVE